MLRNTCGWLRGVLAGLGTLLASASGGTAGEADAPRSTTSADAPVNLFVTAPADLGALWKSLSDPDFVILRGDEYQRLIGRGRKEPGGLNGPLSATVGAVSVGGSIQGDLAELTIEMEVNLLTEGPNWVSLRLDGQSLKEVAEGAQNLPLRAADPGGWQVEVKGRGRHALRVELLAPIRATAEGKRLELAVPEAPSTRVSVVVPRAVSEASAGPGEPVACVPLGGATSRGGPTRLTADLTPRGRIALSWRVEEPATTRLPPLLVAQGEIAVDVDSGSFRTRSSWSIRCLRGETRELVVRLDQDDEVLELELDGQPPPAGVERVGGVTRMTIPLPEPLGPNQEKRLVMTTRRVVPRGMASRVAFSGFPLTNAKEQSGAIGVVSTGNLWVTGNPGRGVRQIDPRTQLPDELRARPATELAFQFSEQPFELSMRIEPSPPLVRVAARTTVALDAKVARLDTRFDFETSRGQLFDLGLGLPPGLEVESVGPADVVADWQIGAIPLPLASGLALGGLRLLTLRLGPKAREGSRFTVQMMSRQPLPTSTGEGAREVSVALIQPIGAISGGGRIAVWTDPGLTADLSDRARGSGLAARFRPASAAPPADWPLPSGRPSALPPMLWLRSDDAPPELPLRVSSHRPTLTEATVLTVHLDDRNAEVVQDADCAAQFGSVGSLDVIVPASLASRWEVDGATKRQVLRHLPDGAALVRLDLATDLARRPARLHFRFRVPLEMPATPGVPVVVSIPWIKIDGATASTPLRATVESPPTLAVQGADPAWHPTEGGAATGNEGGGSLSVSAPATGPVADALKLTVVARALATLPRVLASRLLLRTDQAAEGELRTSAVYRFEVHEPTIDVALPTGVVLQSVRVGGVLVARYESLAEPGGVRIGIPAALGAGPVLVELNYTATAARGRGPWGPPRLLGPSVVQQTLWEIRLPWSRAAVGVPLGWSDENEWFWDAYVWKRRPWLNAAALATWVGSSGGRATSEADPGGDGHGYLFGRAGGPVALPLTVASRALLVAVCSGFVLLLGGVLILFWRPSARPLWMAGSVFGLALGTVVEPSVTFLIVQSGMVGVFLTLLLAAMHRLVERGRPGLAVVADSNARTAVPASASTASHHAPAGADDSTAIRVKSVSTMNHVPTAASPLASATTPADGAALAEPASRRGVAP